MSILARTSRISLGFAMVALGLGSCAQPGEQTSGSGSSDGGSGEQLQVVTTFLPMTQFTNAVAGSCAEVTQLLPTNIGPHDYQAKPTDAQNLANADVLVQNGLELEAFLGPLIENAGNADLKIVTSSDGLELLAMGEGGHDHGGEKAVKKDEGHDEHGHDEHGHDEHGHDDHDEHGHDEHAEGEAHAEHDEDGHSEEEHAAGKGADAHAGHDHGEFDPHVWLDPLRAIEQVNNIRDGLIAAASDCEAEFTANAAAYTDQLQQLHTEIEQTLAPYSGKTFVTYHEFANYFAERYGLEAEFLVGVPEESPAPEDVQRVMAAVEESELKTLLTDSENSASAFEALAQDLGVQVSTFQPNEAGGEGSTEPSYYLEVLRQNVENLKTAFAGS